MYNPDAQDRAPVAQCHECQGEIWNYEPLFFWNGKWICLDCYKDHINAMLEDDPVQLAYEMNIKVMRYV